MTTQQLVNNVNSIIITPLITLAIAAGLLVFIWGLIEFLIGLNGYNDRKEDGKRHMLWGIIGLFIMVAAVSLLKVIDATVGSNVVH